MLPCGVATLTLLPDPVVIGVALPEPLVWIGLKILTPAPVAIPLVLPSAFVGGLVGVKTMTYVGTGHSDHHVTGVGFPPQFVIVVNSTLLTEPPILSHKDFPAGLAAWLGGAGGLDPNLITSLDVDGFSVALDIATNKAGELYHVLALREVPSRIRIDKYIGDGTDLRSFTGAGFAPKFGAVFKSTGGFWVQPMWRTLSIAAGEAAAFFGAQDSDPYVGTSIKSLDVDGFTVEGTSHLFNQDGAEYCYLLLGGNIAEQGSYPGNGVDDRIVTLGEVIPRFTMLKDPKTARECMFRTDTMASNACARCNDAPEPVADAIQEFLTTNFEVGTHDFVNTNGVVYHYAGLGGWVYEPRVVAPDSVVIELTFPAIEISKSLTLTPGAVSIELTLPEPTVYKALTVQPEPVTLRIDVPVPLLYKLLELTPTPVTLTLVFPTPLIRMRGRAAVGDVKLVAGGVAIGDARVTVGDAMADDARVVDGNVTVEDE
jgi:hypothetical protein